jgi:hypothetical protein
MTMETTEPTPIRAAAPSIPRALPYLNDRGDTVFDRAEGYDIALDGERGIFYVDYPYKRLEHRTLSTLKRDLGAQIRTDARAVDAVTFSYAPEANRYERASYHKADTRQVWRYGRSIVSDPRDVKLLSARRIAASRDGDGAYVLFKTPDDRTVDDRNAVIAPANARNAIVVAQADFAERERALRERHNAEERALVEEYDAWVASLPRIDVEAVQRLNPHIR